MNNGPDPQELRLHLLAWFRAHARDLPWRRSRDPYAVWISEIMLQQTRVAAVIDYYARFIKRFPTLPSLANADEEEVLAHWSGLGYYRRARLLHKAAQIAMRDFRGRLPASSTELRTLPGIGEYTSAAIASIAFQEPVACIDGNVERVLLRIRGWNEKSATAANLRAEAGRLLDSDHPGAFNQAMMELGATLCLPRHPLCLQCPVRGLCATRGEHSVAPRKKMRRQHSAYALIRNGSKVLLEHRRTDATLMPGMWELPEIDPNSAPPHASSISLRHSITNTNYSVSIYTLGSRRALPRRDTERQWFPFSELHRLPLTGLTRKMLQRLDAWSPPANSTPPAPPKQLQPESRVEFG